VPYGIMRTCNRNVIIYINRIQLQQCDPITTTTVTQPIDVLESEPKYLIQPTMCGYNSETRTNSHALTTSRVYSNSYNVIYDSIAEGVEFKPMSIKYDPRKISISIRIILNNYVVTADEKNILSYVDENNKTTTTGTTTTDSGSTTGTTTTGTTTTDSGSTK
jgi:hypothetical protein